MIKERLLKNGTTTASYFATIHYDATVVLCDVIGQYERVSPLGAFPVSVACSKGLYRFWKILKVMGKDYGSWKVLD